MKTRSGIVNECRRKIQKRLDLQMLPKISVKVRSFEGPDNRGRYHLSKHKDHVDEPAESLRDSRWFDKSISQFQYNYYQLPNDTRKDIPYELYLIEPLVHVGRVVIAGGLNWIIMGELNNGEKYTAIKDVEVRSMLRGCSLMTLMTYEEIDLAKKKGCDFIHTWHGSDNPSFLAAVAPELKAGFFFYRGDIGDGERYEGEGCIHLRYYLDRKKNRNVRMIFKDGTELKSPKNNPEIIRHLLQFDKYPGKQITKIEEYQK